METVYKYKVDAPNETGRSWIDLPIGGQLLSVGLQNDQMVVWALVDPDHDLGLCRLIVANTSQEIPGFPEASRFLGTLTTSKGIVWHVWDGEPTS